MTIRQEIIDALKVDKYSVLDICQMWNIEKKEAIGHLKHISKSILPKNKLIREHAVCNTCGMVFKDRLKFHSPSKCPKCKHESISETRFWID